MRTAAHVCFVGMLVLLVFLAVGCGGASKVLLWRVCGRRQQPLRVRAGPLEPQAGTALRSEFASCMRSQGFGVFPTRAGRSFPGSNSRRYCVPMVRCNKLYPSSGSAGVPLTEAQRTLLAQARCLRSHGVPNFPDPTFPRTGGAFFRPYPGSTPARQQSSEPPRRAGVRGSPAGAEDVLFRERPQPGGPQALGRDGPPAAHAHFRRPSS